MLLADLGVALRIAQYSEPNDVDLIIDNQEGPKGLGNLNGGLEFGKGCPDPTVKLAICLAGSSRRMGTQAWTKQAADGLLIPLQGANVEGLTRKQADVFVHTKLGEGDPGEDREASQQVPGHPERWVNKREWVEQSCREINATSCFIEEGLGPPMHREQLANPSCFHPHNSERVLEAAMGYYHSINGCKGLLEEAEKKAGKKFDVVLFARADIVFTQSTKFEDYLKSVQCEKSLFVGDPISIQTRPSFEIFGNIWNDQFQNPNPSMCNMKGKMEDFVYGTVPRIQKEVGPAAYLR